MNIIILAESLRIGDAVGNCAIQEYQVLTAKGHQVRFFTNNYDKWFHSHLVNRDVLLKVVKEKDTLLLYHHSILWEEGGLIVNTASCKIILRYHNITPDHFFAKYNEFFYQLSKQGRLQTRNLIGGNKIGHYIADSNFNAAELVECGVPQTKISVLAPFHKIDDFNKTHLNFDLLETLLDGKINILSVGRIVPNKGFHHAIEVMDRYLSHFGSDIRLHIVGGADAHFQTYMNELTSRITGLTLDSHVVFTGKVSFEDLHTYYSASHVFLHMSEHEGFCVPLLEAQYHKLPIIALNRCAVKDTLGDEQLTFDECDYDVFASAIHTVVTDNTVRTYIAECGYENYRKYRSADLSKKMLRIINERI